MASKKLHVDKGAVRARYLATGRIKGTAEHFGISATAVENLIAREGLRAKRKEVVIRSKRNQEIIKDSMVESIVREQQKRAEEHFEWQKETIDEAKERLKLDAESRARLSTHVANAEAIDRLARKAYGLGASDPVSAHHRQVAILLNVQPPEKRAEGRVVDV